MSTAVRGILVPVLRELAVTKFGCAEPTVENLNTASDRIEETINKMVDLVVANEMVAHPPDLVPDERKPAEDPEETPIPDPVQKDHPPVSSSKKKGGK